MKRQIVLSTAAVDVSELPETMPVVDSNGDVVGYAKTAEVYAPPSDDPSDPATKRRVAERLAKGLPPEMPAPAAVYDVTDDTEIGDGVVEGRDVTIKWKAPQEATAMEAVD